MATPLVLQPEVPYVPTCSRLSLQDFYDEWSSRGEAFDLSQPKTYIFDQVVPSTIPGIVLGIIALVGFLIYLVWVFASCCCACCAAPCCRRACCCGRRRSGAGCKASLEPETTQQFITAAEAVGSKDLLPYSASLPPAPVTQPRRRCACITRRTLFWAFFMALGLAAIGVSAWGLASSLQETDDTVSDFWGIVRDAQSRVHYTALALEDMHGQAVALQQASTVLSDNQQVVKSTLGALGVPAAEAADVAQVVAKIPEYIAEAPKALDSVVGFLVDTVNTTITDLTDKFEPPTMAIEEQWRFIPIAVLFGVMILVVSAVLPAVYWAKRCPRTATFLVALLWLCTALLMLLGTGLLRGLYTVSSDGCLYAETFAIGLARQKTANKAWGDEFVSMLQFYTGQNVEVNVSRLQALVSKQELLAPLAAYFPDDSEVSVAYIYNTVAELVGVAGTLTSVLTDPQVQQTVSQVAVAAGLNSDVVVQAVGRTVNNLTSIADRRNVEPLYHSVKEYICCNLHGTSYDLWVAWTVVGCLGLVLAFLSSGRLMRTAWHRRKAAKAGQEPPAGAAILWHSTSGRHGSEQSAALSGSKSSEQAFAAAPQQQSMAAGRGSSPSPRIEALHPASSAAAEEPPAGFPGAYARV
ncbi:hypothetical protein COHA_010473 [Chlorella ohadii]|uniref:Uncharacterized protein n=1 Tax=Chlorella ohadii TaxID=2649997 RepID=A0AAD5H186_9CHLO|nr:hypothetical protein COHA_010473 [Chlorella ohadii]